METNHSVLSAFPCGHYFDFSLFGLSVVRDIISMLCMYVVRDVISMLCLSLLVVLMQHEFIDHFIITQEVCKHL